MQILRGKGVSQGIAIGRARVLTRLASDVRRAKSQDPQREWQRFETARRQASRELEQLYERSIGSLGEEQADIFRVQAMMAQDEDLADAVRERIERECESAEGAVLGAADRLASVFSHMEDEYMRQRAADVKDVAEHVVRCLTGASGQTERPSGQGGEGEHRAVICASDLSPAQTVELDRQAVCAFVTAGGSSNSHTAILSRTMGLPAVVALGEESLGLIREGVTVALDAEEGVVYVEPDAATLDELRRRAAKQGRRAHDLERYRHMESRTLDGVRLEICANVGSLFDVEQAQRCGAEGIGLFRSEFLYIGREQLPDEQEQLEVYRQLLETMKGKRVVVRTLDVGADKQTAALTLEREENPALGLRAVRVSLRYPEVFLTQARALLRAAQYGPLCVMFPLITSVQEVKQLKGLWGQAQQQLRQRGEAFSSEVQLGIMIETPAAALISDRLAPLVDFFSIGTNDLTQYTLAIDRQNPALDGYYDTHHEAVLRLIEHTVKQAKKQGIWVGICGELGADGSLTENFLRMGVDEISVTPSAVLPLRRQLCSLCLTETRACDGDRRKGEE